MGTYLNIIEDTKTAKEEIRKKSAEVKALTEAIESDTYSIEREYNSKIHQLERERYDKVYELNSKKKSLKDEAQAVYEELRKPIKTYDKILALIGISKKPEKELPLTVRAYRDRFYELIDNPINDKYLNLQVYVYRNDKPKNKYTLCIAGRSIFGKNDKIINYTFSYGCDLNFTECYPSILMDVKDAPTIEELKEWWNKNKNRPFWNKTEHEETIKMYEWVLENCNTAEWQLAYLENRKEYYENNVSRGTDQPEYKEILKQMQALDLFSQLTSS